MGVVELLRVIEHLGNGNARLGQQIQVGDLPFQIVGVDRVDALARLQGGSEVLIAAKGLYECVQCGDVFRIAGQQPLG